MKIRHWQFIVMIGLLLVILTEDAFAQQSVNVRSGLHADYNRIVFDWPQKPSYSINKSGDILTISFKAAATLNSDKVDASTLPNIVAFAKGAQNDSVTNVNITLPSNAKYRNFAIGGKIIIDVYNPSNAQKVAAETPNKAVEKATSENAPTDTLATKTPSKTPSKTIEKTEVEAKDDEGEGAKNSPDSTVIESTLSQAVKDEGASSSNAQQSLLAPLDVQPHVINITSTRSFGLSVFQRGHWLWIIKDDPAIGVMPQLVGPDVEKFGEFDRFDINDGLAYRLKLPQGMHAVGRGGGLTWEIVLSPYEREQDSIPLEREYDESDPVRGANLVWPVIEANKILEFRDPEIGDTITVVTSDTSKIRHREIQNFIELDTLPATIGMAVRAKVDDLEVRKLDNQVVISRAGGLVLAKASEIKAQELNAAFDKAEANKAQSDMRKIFSFDTWEMGGISALQKNQSVLMAGLGNKDLNDKVTDILTLVKLNLTNQRAHEALGFLRVAESERPNIVESPEYRALRGAANIMAGRPEDAIGDLTDEAFDEIGEIGYWRAYALSQVEDWQQAFSVMPKDFTLLETYPENVRLPVTLALAEVALRGANVQAAETLLGDIEDMAEQSYPRYSAGWNYLRGELERQRNNVDGAAEYWRTLEKGTDDYHRVKALLALTQLETENKVITASQAIDRLEGLRYAWRGDQLETLINYRLAMAYVEEKQYLKGLTMLRNAASLTPGTKLADYVTQQLTTLFRDIFFNDLIKDIPAIDAITLYEEFRELTPPGEEGNVVSLKLADRLANAELLGRSSDILQQLVTRRLSGETKIQAGLRLAGIQLLDDKPEGTLRTIDVVQQTLDGLSDDGAENLRQKYRQEVALLKARAMAELNDTEAALENLGDLPADKDVLRIKVDLAWRDGRWDDAANALQDLMFLENVMVDKPLPPLHAELVLNRSIALNLSGNRVALANLRNRYGDLMDDTAQARLFNVVSRERQSRLSGDREVLTQMIGEVDLFGEFLDIYKSGIDSEAITDNKAEDETQ